MSDSTYADHSKNYPLGGLMHNVSAPLILPLIHEMSVDMFVIYNALLDDTRVMTCAVKSS
jgi:hypothetical protein